MLHNAAPGLGDGRRVVYNGRLGDAGRLGDVGKVNCGRKIVYSGRKVNYGRRSKYGRRIGDGRRVGDSYMSLSMRQSDYWMPPSKDNISSQYGPLLDPRRAVLSNKYSRTPI
eukprot:sb/3477049/